MRNRTAMVLVLAFAPVVFAEEVDNPAYKAWATHKVGTRVVTKMTSEGPNYKTEQLTTHKLLELTAEKAVVETVTTTKVAGMEIAGAPMKLEHLKTLKVPGKQDAAPEQKADAPKAETKTSEETVKVAGKEYKCKVIETKLKQGTSKLWTCETVPGMTVKMEMDFGGTKSTMELVEIKTP